MLIPAQAQLPAGTTDATQPQTQKQDPLLTQANGALDKQDYPTALKLLTTLAAKSPNDPHLLYDLAFAQDALAETPAQIAEAETTYRRAIAADPTYFDPHLALGLLLARSGKLTLAHAELLQATTLNTDNPLLKARAFRALARIEETANPGTASDELLSALKLSPRPPRTFSSPVSSPKPPETPPQPKPPTAACSLPTRKITTPRPLSPISCSTRRSPIRPKPF